MTKELEEIQRQLEECYLDPDTTFVTSYFGPWETIEPSPIQIVAFIPSKDNSFRIKERINDPFAIYGVKGISSSNSEE